MIALKNPKDLLLDIERQAIELSYAHEFPQGLFRKQIRHYDERVIRELLINAIVHKNYTIARDIFIKVFSDRLEISNPGGLPFGITQDNILHHTIRRNSHLIRILHDLELMEGEETGYNLIYEINSRDAKPFPIPISDYAETIVIQHSKILNEEAVTLIDFIANHYRLSQKEFIVLGIITRHKKVLAPQLAKHLQLSDTERLRSYISRLLDQGIIISRGIKKGTEYLINPKLISHTNINIKPSLKLIEPHRLKALIVEDLKYHPGSKLREIHTRLEDAQFEDIRKAVYSLVKGHAIRTEGGKKNKIYYLA